MITIEFDKIHDKYYSVEDIEKDLIKSLDGFIFITRIEIAHNYSDLAFNWLEAAFVGQQLTKFSKQIKVNKKSGYGYDSIIEFVLKPTDVESLSKLIFSFGKVYSGDNEEVNEEFLDNLYIYKDNLNEIAHSYPELVDDYYANYINGVYYEYDPIQNKDFFDNEFFHFPERKYGFVKSAYSNIINQSFYTSLDSIIIPNSSDLNQVLKEYSGIEHLDFIKAEFLALGNITYLISNGFIIHFPFDLFIKAKNCAWKAIEPKEDRYEVETDWLDGFLSFRRSISQYNEEENYKGYPEDLAEHLIISSQTNNQELFTTPSVVCFYVSSYGDHILIKDANYSYFFYGTDKLTINELGFLGNRLSVLFNTTANLAGIHVEIKCPWEQLNDESFEDICFDIIYYNPKFDNSTIRKMGKTRSRDGGRDIEVFTYSRPGKPSQKYIFQCKYQKPHTSLTGSKIQDVSDTIIQYRASGYGIMTNVVIDATLFDKLDRIGQNMNVEVEDYSVYKLERILACYPQLKQRYFK